MASQALATGAGAAAGLDDLLSRMHEEELVAEAQRSHKADEALRGREIDETAASRKATVTANSANNAEMRRQGQEAQTRGILALRPIGAPVDPTTMNREVSSGSDPSFYDVKPGAKVSQLAGMSTIGANGPEAVPGGNTIKTDQTSPLNAPDDITFKGTQPAIEKQTVDKSNAEAKIQDLTVKMQNAATAAERAMYQNQLAQANTELTAERSKHVGDAKPLPATTADQMAGLNVAEVEGVKVLKSLHDSGLDGDNDPASPRWNKFVVTTLKMSPADFNKADIQQRTAAINAMLTRGLMGARPSQYIAQIIQQHLPQGDMTGSQLAHVIHNVLEQATERRTEVESLSGREPGSLAPKSGMSYRQYLDSGGAAPNTNTGGGDDAYQEYLKRSKK